METNKWKQWDAQEERRRAREAAETKRQMRDRNYIELNNLYLAIERGAVALTITTANELRVLASRAYEQGDQFIDWWNGEFQKLEGWDNV